MAKKGDPSGLSKLVDLIGKRFGRLLVVSRATNYKGKATWNCQCDCGDTRVNSGTHLRTGQLTSCGCYRAENAAAIRRKRPYEALYNSVARRSKSRYDSSLTYEQFLSFTKEDRCGYCYAPVVWAEFAITNHGHTAAYNLDRVDNSKGYHVDNLIVCCGRCNKAKSDHFTHDEWMEAMTFLRKRHMGL